MGGTLKVIGLTGGIGSGKSTVSKYLAEEKGVKVLDADKFASDLLKKGSETLAIIRNEFGKEVFDWRGRLDKEKLAQIVFNDKDKLEFLESVTTKRVCKTIKKIILLEKNYVNQHDELNGIVAVCCIDAPLLFEHNLDELCDETWLVTCDHDTKIQRIIERDGSTEEEIINRMDNQMSDKEKSSKADIIIDNSGNLSDLFAQVDQIYQEFYEKRK